VAEVDLALGGRDQPRRLGGLEVGDRQAELGERRPDHVHPAGVGGGGDEQRRPRRALQRVERAAEGPLHAGARPQRLLERLAAGALAV
jgi:hypothetical protein